MTFEAHRSPARVSVAAASRLPRWVLWALLAAYGVAGLFGRDLWFQDDASAFGVMFTMANGGPADWLLPNVMGASVAEEGPLAFWIGAVCIRLLGPLLGDPLAARLTCLLWIFVAAAALWYSTCRLARRAEAQPVAFVFGGEANSRDYGRMLADVAVLLFVATVGIAPRMHETTAETAAAALVPVVLFGLVLALDRPRAGEWIAGLALGALALTRGLAPALFVLAAIIVAGPVALRGPDRWRVPGIVAAVAAVSFAFWPLAANLALPEYAGEFFAQWSAWTIASVSLPGATELGRIGRNFPTYAWPLWPLALWTAYAWRHSLRAPHLALPGLLSLATLARLAFSNPGEDVLILTVPSLVPLAAFGAITLRRAAENAFDWFSIAVFSLLVVSAWAYFVALLTGVPPKMAASIARLVPGFAPHPNPAAIAAGVAASVVWFALVAWRVRTRPPMLWRGPVLAAGGLAVLWIVINALYLPAVNYRRTYAGLAEQAAARAAALARPGCAVAHRLLPAHRALFAQYGGLRFVAPEHESACTLALHRDDRRSRLDDEPPPGNWEPIWEGSWRTRPDEVFRLYRRVN